MFVEDDSLFSCWRRVETSDSGGREISFTAAVCYKKRQTESAVSVIGGLVLSCALSLLLPMVSLKKYHVLALYASATHMLGEAGQ